MSIYSDWMIIKNVEREAVAKRREIEDEMLRQLQVDDVEGSQTLKREGFKVRVTNRYNRKVDSDLLQDIATEEGLDHLLPVLFRWKPEIKLKEWQSADESAKQKLAQAITTTPGRASLQIEED